MRNRGERAVRQAHDAEVGRHAAVVAHLVRVDLPAVTPVLSLELTPTTVHRGEVFTATARLDAPYPDQDIVFQDRQVGSDVWRTSYTDTTDVHGSVMVVFDAGESSASFRTTFAGTNQNQFALRSAASPPVLLTVRRLTPVRAVLTASSRRVRPGSAVELDVSTGPRAAGRAVTLQQAVGRAWVSVQHARTAADGHHVFDVEPGCTTAYRATAAGDDDRTRGVARSIRISVVRRGG